MEEQIRLIMLQSLFSWIDVCDLADNDDIPQPKNVAILVFVDRRLRLKGAIGTTFSYNVAILVFVDRRLRHKPKYVLIPNDNTVAILVFVDRRLRLKTENFKEMLSGTVAILVFVDRRLRLKKWKGVFFERGELQSLFSWIDVCDLIKEAGKSKIYQVAILVFVDRRLRLMPSEPIIPDSKRLQSLFSWIDVCDNYVLIAILFDNKLQSLFSWIDVCDLK